MERGRSRSKVSSGDPLIPSRFIANKKNEDLARMLAAAAAAAAAAAGGASNIATDSPLHPLLFPRMRKEKL